MAKKRFTDIEIWDREWYMELKPVHKCLMKYIFDKCDAAGCWKPNWKLASLHIGENVNFADLSKLPKSQYEILDSGKIFIPDFIKFQYGKLSERSPAHNCVFLAIENNNLSNRVFNRVSNTPKEMDMEKEEEKEVEKEEEKESEWPTDTLKKYMIPQMQKIWKEKKPDYPDDPGKDTFALQAIAMFICKQAGINYYLRKKDDDKNLYELWGTIAQFVASHNFFKNYSLHQVEKYIQTIIQEQNNGTKKYNGSASSNGASSPGTSIIAADKKYSGKL